MHDSTTLRYWIKLCEAQMDDDSDDEDDAFNREYEEDDTRYDKLPPSTIVTPLKTQIAAAAQKVYDDWIQDEDDDLNGGGVCHLIADKVADILGNAGVPVATQCASDVQHVSCIAQFNDGVFEIDIPYWLYERGGGFTWTKLPDIQFTPDYVSIHRLDGDPAKMSQYVEEWEESDE